MFSFSRISTLIEHSRISALAGATLALPLLLLAGICPAQAQDTGLTLTFPDTSNYAPALSSDTLAQGMSELTLGAQLTDESPELKHGLIWRIFKPDAGPDGKLPFVASAEGGTSVFHLQPGSYLVHVAFGRAGATKKISLGKESQYERLVLDAGGLKLDAVVSGNISIPSSKLLFSVFDSAGDAESERGLVAKDVKPNAIVRLNAGTYHVVSNYGSVNSVVRSDITVEAGKLTEVTVEHHAAEITLKLVREEGGEAIADTAWSIVSNAGDPIRENVGAYFSVVLAEGDYAVIAKNRDRIYQRDFSVVPGRNRDVEVLATEGASDAADTPQEAD